SRAGSLTSRRRVSACDCACGSGGSPASRGANLRSRGLMGATPPARPEREPRRLLLFRAAPGHAGGRGRMRRIRAPQWTPTPGDLKWLRRITDGCFRSMAPAPDKPDPFGWQDDRITLSWLGHATVLLNFFGITILVDPVLRSRVGLAAGPLTIGPKR